MRVYISGPITGMPQSNEAAFAATAKFLRDYGYEAVNPLELHPGPTSWEAAMRADIKALMDCDRIVALPGWERSTGALIELRLAADIGIRRIDLSEVA